MKCRRWVFFTGLAWGILAATGCGDDSTSSAGGVADSAIALKPARGQLVSAVGEVTLTREGTRAPAQPGPLLLGDAIETGAGASAEIRFRDGRAIQVGENARFVLEEGEGGLVLTLAQGVMLSRVPADRADAGEHVVLSVRTPYGLTRLGNDAQDVELSVSGGTGRVDVRLGEVVMVGKDGKSTSAKAGDRLELGGGKVELISRTPADAVPLSLQTIRVVVKGGAGTEIKPKGSARWHRVSSKGEALEEGSAVRTSRVPARLLLAGARSSLEMSPNTEVVVGQFGKRGEREESKLELRRGRVTQVAKPGGQTELALPDVAVETESSGTRYELQRTGKALELRAVAGDLKVTSGGKQQAVKAGVSINVAPGASSETMVLEPSTLRLVSRSGQRIFHPGISDVTLSWPGEAGDYQIEVAEDSAFEQPVVVGKVHGPSVSVPAPRRGSLYWHVKNAAGEENKGSALFAPESSRDELQRLRNEVPDGSEKTTIFFQDKPPAVTFTFGQTENAAKYRLAVFKVTELHTPVAERETPETRVRLDEGALVEGNYVWSITPVSATGTVLPTRGRMNKLEMVYDNAVPQLIVLSPHNGDPRGKTQARGIAPLGSRVYINGKPAPLDEKGRFDTAAFPQGMPPVIIFRLARPGEADSVTVRVLK